MNCNIKSIQKEKQYLILGIEKYEDNIYLEKNIYFNHKIKELKNYFYII